MRTKEFLYQHTSAFTLAEVLITLVVIGVIAALTVPALIQNTQKQEYITALKKAHSTLSQAAQQIIADEGTPKCDEGGWLCSIDDVYDKFKIYLNNAKECGRGAECIDFGKIKRMGDAKTWNNMTSSGYTGGYRTLVFADGMQAAFLAVINNCGGNAGNYDTGSRNVCAPILVDINGAKGPNKIGDDVFGFVLKENGLYPAGCDHAGHCSRTRADWNLGCACKVLTEGAMNY